MRTILAMSVLASLTLAACTPAAPPSPTAVPPKPAAAPAPAQAAATAAPAKPAATAAPAKPTEQPAAKPTEKPAAKPAAFDEKAVADFYKGKTVRIIVGFGPGGAVDTNARSLQRVVSKYIPGNPTIVVENRPGAGSMLAANTVYGAEPKDGTVVAAVDQGIILQQAIGAKGVQFDAAKYQWLASTYDTSAMCAARTDSGINSVQDVMEGGKELTVSSYGKGTSSYDPPAVLNVALGTKFKIVLGYDGGAAQRLAVKNKEVQGFCTTFETIAGIARDMFEGSNPQAKVLIVTGSEVQNHPFLKGVPAAEKLAKTDEARTLLKLVHATQPINLPLAVAPEVPRDRVEALRSAFAQGYKDQEYLDAAQKAQQSVSPKTGEQVTRIVQEILGAPPATLAKLKEMLE